MKLNNPLDLKKEIALKGYNLRGYSLKIGISHSYLSQILNNKKNPSPKVAKKISEGLDKDIRIFFTYDG